MAWEWVLLLLGAGIGFWIAKYIFSKQKWSDKKATLEAQWEKRFSDQQNENKLQISELQSKFDVDLQKNQTEVERINKDWGVRYAQDLETFKGLFQKREQLIRLKSVSASRRTLVGKFIERFVPFLSNVKYAPSDMHFLGQPVDYIVFDGLANDKIERVVFLEVKTGASQLTKREKSLKEAIQKKRIFWEEVRVDTGSETTPDAEMLTDEEVAVDLYKDIDEKIATAKSLVASAKKTTGDDEEDVEVVDVTCPHCDEDVEIELDTIGYELYEKGKSIEVECPECTKKITIHIDDEEEDEELPQTISVKCVNCRRKFSAEFSSEEYEEYKSGEEWTVTCTHCGEDMDLLYSDK